MNDTIIENALNNITYGSKKTKINVVSEFDVANNNVPFITYNNINTLDFIDTFDDVSVQQYSYVIKVFYNAKIKGFIDDIYLQIYRSLKDLNFKLASKITMAETNYLQLVLRFDCNDELNYKTN